LTKTAHTQKVKAVLRRLEQRREKRIKKDELRQQMLKKLGEMKKRNKAGISRGQE